jgi:hypothetical protein
MDRNLVSNDASYNCRSMFMAPGRDDRRARLGRLSARINCGAWKHRFPAADRHGPAALGRALSTVAPSEFRLEQ